MIKDIVVEKDEITIIEEGKTQSFPFHLTCRALEGTLKGMTYKGEGWVCDERVEKAKLPPIAKTFYYLVATQPFPKAEDVMKHYLLQYFWFCKENKKEVFFEEGGAWFSIEGILARIYRTYPSLVRDLHFFLMCKESGYFDRVLYSLQQDFYEGIDVLVTYNGQNYVVSLYVQTKRGETFKKKKYKRHQSISVPEICLPIDPFDSTKRVGQFTLYQKCDIQRLLIQINNYHSQKNQPFLLNAQIRLLWRFIFFQKK